ncbi:MAG: proline--tRNA ligase [Thermomicrobiales bacterium]|nr:proline--tRNA ligase [Thermomicrobiales bacterium]MCO5224876.1 proline--tRNA ligase [Thermomicrobiales bacterium]MCO5228946.1 proline--tRNA ligase [Thermomicrobiales bacterium]
MRMAKLFGRTVREVPADAEFPSHQLMVRAAMIRPLGAGIYTLMPLGYRVVKKVEAIIHEEMDRIGGQELLMPFVHTADVWKETERYYQIGPEMARFEDRAGRDMVLAMTHEEVVADLLRTDVNSYKQLPQIVYHLQTKWRDEPRARGGLIRVREFTMKDSYSLDVDEAGLEESYEAHAEAYDRIFTRFGLDYIKVGADVGMMGGSKSEEYMAFSPHGEDVILICPNGDYAANREVAIYQQFPASDAEMLPLEEVETPNASTIQGVADYLDVPLEQTAKAVFFMAGEQFIFLVIRGDLEVNETKLRNALQVSDLVPATTEQIAAIGAVAGYASPIGVHDATVVVDESVAKARNLVAGANKEGFHVRNSNVGRDYEADLIADVAAAAAGHLCPVCGEPMVTRRAIEVGNIFKLGTRYTEKLGATYLDQNGKAQPVVMGSYGIGVGRSAATAVEQYHDDKGIKWPISIAPFHASLLSIGKDEDVIATTDALYAQLGAAGVEVLYDDRNERPGVKFNDADLIGNPVRLSISRKTLDAGEVELKLRSDDNSINVPLDGIAGHVRELVDGMLAELQPVD